MDAPRVVVVGGISLDVFALVTEPVQPDSSLLAEQLYVGPGGKGANQAVAAARLGADVVLCQLEVPVVAVQTAVERAGRSERLIVVDPAPPVPGAAELAQLADTVMLNADEASQLTGVEPHDEPSAREAARRLRTRGAFCVAVSAGAAGHLLAWNGERVWNAVPRVEAVDTTGAGDALHAALAVRLAVGDEPSHALRWASAAGAVATTRLGARAVLPRPADVDRLLARQR